MGAASPRSPGTHLVGPWATDSIDSYRDLRTGTQNMGNWASMLESGLQVLRALRFPGSSCRSSYGGD